MAKKVNDLIAALGAPAPSEPTSKEVVEIPRPFSGPSAAVAPMRVEPKTVSQNKRKRDTGGILYLTLTHEEEETLRHLCYRTRKTRAEAGREALRDLFEKYRFTM